MRLGSSIGQSTWGCQEEVGWYTQIGASVAVLTDDQDWIILAFSSVASSTLESQQLSPIPWAWKGAEHDTSKRWSYGSVFMHHDHGKPPKTTFCFDWLANSLLCFFLIIMLENIHARLILLKIFRHYMLKKFMHDLNSLNFWIIYLVYVQFCSWLWKHCDRTICLNYMHELSNP